MEGDHPDRPADESPPARAEAFAARAEKAEEALRASEERYRLLVELAAIGRLAGGVAHDFNNQLTGILGGAEVLAEALAGDAALLSVVDGIRDAALRSARLTRRLSFARKEASRAVLVDVHRTVEEVVALLARSVDERIAVRCALDAPSAEVRGDPARLHAALLNLALNACDAMPDGGTLSVETRLVRLDEVRCAALPFDVRPGPHLEIRVVDTGVGFSTEARARLFEPFFTTKAPGKGSGLGLAEVYGTVQTHRGAVVVHSAPGEGTAVTLWLPIAPAAEGERGARHPARPLRVLVVDDEPNVRTTLCVLLRAHGHSAVECDGGHAGVARYAEDWRGIDVVILDMMMPDLRGEEVLARLRAVNPRVAVIVSSGFSVPAEPGARSPAGRVHFLQKPYTFEELAAVLAAASAGEEAR
jgi:signal transduction histidine kinase/ActR/RegA family two-component response regulator